MASLVSWKKKTSKENEENDGDALGTMNARFVDSMQTPEFIMRDETNARAMKAIGVQWWRKK